MPEQLLSPTYKQTPFPHVKKFDGRILTLDNQTENFLTVGKKNVEVDFYVKWRVADALQYYRSTGGQGLVAADRLSLSSTAACATSSVRAPSSRR